MTMVAMRAQLCFPFKPTRGTELGLCGLFRDFAIGDVLEQGMGFPITMS